MPFQSKAQERFMFARHPEIARRWLREYGQPARMPARKANPVSADSPRPSREGGRRDWRPLRPGQFARHPGKSSEKEAHDNGPVTFQDGSRHRELGSPEKPEGLRARDVRVAARRVLGR